MLVKKHKQNQTGHEHEGVVQNKNNKKQLHYHRELVLLKLKFCQFSAFPILNQLEMRVTKISS